MEYRHIPVMLDEAIEYLNLKKGGNYIDCTLGGAGYTIAIAEKINPGKLLSLDLDDLAIENAKKLLKAKNIENVIIVKDNFRNVDKVIEKEFGTEWLGRFDGIVMDLGLSSAHLDDRKRGFSFKEDTPLDMSFGTEPGRSSETTEEIVNDWPEKELEKIIRQYGEERFAHKIAKKIAESRKEGRIDTTGKLQEVIKQAFPAFYLRKKGIHYATLTFQALRIATNKELESLEEVLNKSLKVLDKEGRIVAISYHSLEDRIVKNFFRDKSKDCICPPALPICNCDHRAELKLITSKAIKPTSEEIDANPRARSAKLRAAQII